MRANISVRYLNIKFINNENIFFFSKSKLLLQFIKMCKTIYHCMISQNFNLFEMKKIVKSIIRFILTKKIVNSNENLLS